MPGGAAVAASEARPVHVRLGRPPSTESEMGLWPYVYRSASCRRDPGRSGRSELSGSGSAHSGQDRDRLEFQLSLSLHDGSWPSVGPTGPSKDPESRGAMGWKQLLPSHGTAGDCRLRCGAPAGACRESPRKKNGCFGAVPYRNLLLRRHSLVLFWNTFQNK